MVTFLVRWIVRSSRVEVSVFSGEVTLFTRYVEPFDSLWCPLFRSGRLTLRLQRGTRVSLDSASFNPPTFGSQPVTPYRSIVQDYGKPSFFLRRSLSHADNRRYIELIQTHSYLANVNFMQRHYQKYLCGAVSLGLLGEGNFWSGLVLQEAHFWADCWEIQSILTTW